MKQFRKDGYRGEIKVGEMGGKKGKREDGMD